MRAGVCSLRRKGPRRIGVGASAGACVGARMLCSEAVRKRACRVACALGCVSKCICANESLGLMEGGQV